MCWLDLCFVSWIFMSRGKNRIYVQMWVDKLIMRVGALQKEKGVRLCSCLCRRGCGVRAWSAPCPNDAHHSTHQTTGNYQNAWASEMGGD